VALNANDITPAGWPSDAFWCDGARMRPVGRALLAGYDGSEFAYVSDRHERFHVHGDGCRRPNVGFEPVGFVGDVRSGDVHGFELDSAVMGSLSSEGDKNVLDDLAAIMEGGENFAARMTAISKAQREARAQEESLKLGVAAQQAFENAKDKHAEAKAVLERAQQYQSDTKLAADKQHTEITAAALKIKAEADEQAKKVLADAQAKAAALITAAQAKHYEAGEHQSATLATKQEAEGLRLELAKALKAAQETQRQADAVRTELNGKLNLLKAAIGNIGGQNG
jgi:hypothetical protein